MTGTNLVIIGFMGCGKTSVSKKLAELLELEAIEVDDIIAKNAEMSIPEIFEKEGEDGFRARETKVLEEALKGSGKVISCGGGVVTRPENVGLLKSSGCQIIRLTATPKTVFYRIGLDRRRPMLSGIQSPEDMAELMAKREKAYLAAGGIQIATDEKTVDDIAKEIAEVL